MKNEDKIVEILEDNEIEEDKAMQAMIKLSLIYGKPEVRISFKRHVDSELLKLQIENEKDPLKKASLIAKRISKSFDE